MVDDFNLGEEQMKRVLVIGDIVADIYRDCYLKKMCPDAPDAPAIIPFCDEVLPGGAANVALNIVALSTDCIVDLIGVTDIALAHKIVKMSKNRVNMDFCYTTIDDDCLTKERLILDGKIIARLDNYERLPERLLHPQKELISKYFELHEPDLIVLSDYNGGLLEIAMDNLSQRMERVLVDTKSTDLKMFDGAAMIKLNEEEARRVMLLDPTPEKHCQSLVVTLGKNGAALKIFKNVSKSVFKINTFSVPGYEVPAIDVCGCGDTFLAGIAATLLRVNDMYTAVRFANAAAATVVRKPRTAIANRQETLELLGEDDAG